ncbi:MAG: plasmid pRiA4b ORF-3 family protein [Planctomycetes bacterium]|nr:plasmid pRiA4b ORF-3 family protein [candidate division WOR-3 bacterium]MBM4029604.1 plasmid pRiA4b ORF-3 family protein [Planctomycetota bacterium]
MKKKGPTSKVYQLKISLNGIRPEIWRRVLVAGATSLHSLHDVIQSEMGWQDCHLHVFRVGDVEYSDPDMEVDGARNEFSARLFRIAPDKGDAFLYDYDFGDGWSHTVEVEAISEQDSRFSGRPVCIDGRGDCPPEDCGGVPGYMRILKAGGKRTRQ